LSKTHQIADLVKERRNGMGVLVEIYFEGKIKCPSFYGHLDARLQFARTYVVDLCLKQASLGSRV
jgi:hypothetical protein